MKAYLKFFLISTIISLFHLESISQDVNTSPWEVDSCEINAVQIPYFSDSEYIELNAIDLDHILPIQDGPLKMKQILIIAREGTVVFL